jgi:2-hydroxy-3-keto-5-methylthiopentenyl-1-phosphate phosphatase
MVERRGARPVVAILYDFDKTLCTKDMQEYSFIPSVGMTREEFWGEAGRLAEKQKMDRILAYLYLMIRKSREKNLPVRRETFVGLGKGIKYFPGVDTWFDRVGAFADSLGTAVEHYIISSGVKEIIEGGSIAKYFTKIYACEFHYEENGVADWPKAVVNYTTKTQYLFRINKGVQDMSDDESLNRYTPEEGRRVPFRNMIYIGDGMTDVPCMKLVKVGGGKSIAVYSGRGKENAESLLKDERADFIFRADYSEGSKLEGAVKEILSGMAGANRLADLHAAQMKGAGRGKAARAEKANDIERKSE